jgi:putative aldouronate transport system permease protein
MVRQSAGERVFRVLNALLLALLAVTTILPFLNVLAKSLSSEAAVTAGQVSFWPVDLQLGTFGYVLRESQFLSSFRVSVFVTAVGTVLAMVLTVMTAYPLSKPKLKLRRLFMMLYVFIMLFSGGMVPNYLLYKALGLLDRVWALITPSLISVFNILLVKTFFEQLPEEVEESARLDGASNLVVLFRLVLPMALPVLATVSLFFAVGYWNSYFSAVLYISKPALKPLQQYLYDLITMSLIGDPTVAQNMDLQMNLTPDGIRSATIIVSTVPILVVYPFLQKYFVKGITIGSVKG